MKVEMTFYLSEVGKAYNEWRDDQTYQWETLTKEQQLFIFNSVQEQVREQIENLPEHEVIHTAITEIKGKDWLNNKETE